MTRESETRRGQRYKGDPRNAEVSSQEVGWGRSTEDREASLNATKLRREKSKEVLEMANYDGFRSF